MYLKRISKSNRSCIVSGSQRSELLIYDKVHMDKRDKNDVCSFAGDQSNDKQTWINYDQCSTTGTKLNHCDINIPIKCNENKTKKQRNYEKHSARSCVLQKSSKSWITFKKDVLSLDSLQNRKNLSLINCSQSGNVMGEYCDADDFQHIVETSKPLETGEHCLYPVCNITSETDRSKIYHVYNTNNQNKDFQNTSCWYPCVLSAVKNMQSFSADKLVLISSLSSHVIVLLMLIWCLLFLPSVRCQTDINECDSDPCVNNATCLNGNNSYTCNCTDGFLGKQCQLVYGETCDFEPCKNNATCVNITTEVQDVLSFNCTCLPGYEGRTCDTEIDYCNSNGLPECQNGATCMNVPPLETFECTCQAGYTGTKCETDIDDCATMPCLNGATCADGIADYTCTCANGWTGSTCDTDINECQEAVDNGTLLCENGGACINENGTYRCNCTAIGYEGLACEIETNECSSTMPCQNSANCTNTVGSYYCNCTLGYMGYNCDQVDCTDLCMNGATCHTEADQTWRCECIQFYEGKQCNVTGPCVAAPCQNNAPCSQTGKEYACDCGISGYEGKNCSQDIDECTAVNNTCLNGATCLNQEGGYNCTCAIGFSGSNCEVDIDECLTNPCINGVCEDMPGAFYCNCDGTGFEGTICDRDVDECNTTNPCQNGTCRNLQPFYVCDCLPGYVGDTCHSKNPCNDTEYCHNGGECDFEVDDTFENVTATCTCIDPWKPPNCMEQPEDVIWPAIVGGVIGAVVLIILIAVLIFVLMRVKDKRATRGTYSPSTQEMSGSRMDMGNNLKVPPPERLI